MSESLSRAHESLSPKKGQNIIVLVEPEIPSNTGNIARTCVLTGTALHLVGPLGFSLEDKYLKRAGLDYWEELDFKLWNNLAEFEAWLESTQLSPVQGQSQPNFLPLYATTRTERTLADLEVQEGQDCLIIFGKETAGLPKDFVAKHPERGLRIPMIDHHSRSLNLANSAAILIYEVLRQQGFRGLS